jgi:hypothetical protein
MDFDDFVRGQEMHQHNDQITRKDVRLFVRIGFRDLEMTKNLIDSIKNQKKQGEE